MFGEIDVQIYAVRKRRGHWAICADENVVLEFSSYDEAIAIARTAVGVLCRSQNNSGLFSKNKPESRGSDDLAA